MIPKHVRKILLVRLSARGDLVFASPLAKAMRERFPQAHIAWLAEARTADVVAHNPHLDEVIVWERGTWKRLAKERRFTELFREVRTFVGGLRARRFDVAVDAQGLLRSGLVTFLSGAGLRFGLGSREGSRVLMTEVIPRGGNDREISSEYKFLAHRLGLGTDAFDIEIPRSPEENEFAAGLVEEHGLGDGFIVACPFTTRFYKHWFEDRWSGLMTRVVDELGLPVVLLGGPDDRPAADRILDKIPPLAAEKVVDLVGRTRLGEASAVVNLCSLLVGVDTGLSHMAHGYGRPTVLLFGSNTPYLEPPLPTSRILWAGLPCSPCRGKLTCDDRVDCMVAHSVDGVLEAVRKGLEESLGHDLPGATSRELPVLPTQDTSGGASA